MTCTWVGEEFEVYDFDPDNWNDVAGVYIFLKYHLSEDAWQFLYVGKTQSFLTRLSAHEKWRAASRLGATHVHAKVVRLGKDRTRLERRLIREYDPPLNRRNW